MGPILESTPPITWKRCLVISLIGVVVLFCSCISILYYIGSNMSTEEIEALDATRTSNALPPSERDTVVPPKATATVQPTPEAKAPATNDGRPGFMSEASTVQSARVCHYAAQHAYVARPAESGRFCYGQPHSASAPPSAGG